MTSSPAPDTQKAVCIVTTWPSPPQGWWSVETPHSEVGCLSLHSCNGPSSVSLLPRGTSRPSSLYSRIDLSIRNVPSLATFTPLKRVLKMLCEVFSAQWPLPMTSVKIPRSSPLLDVFQDASVKIPYHRVSHSLGGARGKFSRCKQKACTMKIIDCLMPQRLT